MTTVIIQTALQYQARREILLFPKQSCLCAQMFSIHAFQVHGGRCGELKAIWNQVVLLCASVLLCWLEWRFEVKRHNNRYLSAVSDLVNVSSHRTRETKVNVNNVQFRCWRLQPSHGLNGKGWYAEHWNWGQPTHANRRVSALQDALHEVLSRMNHGHMQMGVNLTLSILVTFSGIRRNISDKN